MDKLKQGYRWTELCKERTGMTPREFEKQYQTKWTPEITLIPTLKLEEMQSQLQAAQAKIKELEQAQEWISVEDKIPYYGQIVLLKINNVVQEVTFIFDGADDCADWFEPHNMNEPEHGVMLDGKNRVEWLPLPPQPKGE